MLSCVLFADESRLPCVPKARSEGVTLSPGSVLFCALVTTSILMQSTALIAGGNQYTIYTKYLAVQLKQLSAN